MWPFDKIRELKWEKERNKILIKDIIKLQKLKAKEIIKLIKVKNLGKLKKSDIIHISISNELAEIIDLNFIKKELESGFDNKMLLTTDDIKVKKTI